PSIFGTPNTPGSMVGIFTCLAMLYLLIKIPMWGRQFVLGRLGAGRGRGFIGQVIHTILTIKTLGALAGAGRGRSSAAWSALPAPQAPSAPAPRQAPAGFSHAPTPATPRRPASGTAPAATFSAAPRPQTAPRRPPAPVTPVFSTPARTAPAGGNRAARSVPAP